MNTWMDDLNIRQLACMVKPENLDKYVKGFERMLGVKAYEGETVVENKAVTIMNGEKRSDVTLHAKNFMFDNVQLEFLAPNQAPSGWSLRLNWQGEKFSHFATVCKDRDRSMEAAKKEGWFPTIEGQEVWGGYANLEHTDNPWFYSEMWYTLDGSKWADPPMIKDRPKADYLDDLVICDVGVAVRDLDDAVDKICGIYGLEKPEIKTVIDEKALYHGTVKPIKKRSARIPFDNIPWEFYEAEEDGGIYKEWLDTQGEGMSHFTFAVSNLDSSIEKAEKMGLQMFQKGNDDGVEYACLTYSEIPMLYIKVIQK